MCKHLRRAAKTYATNLEFLLLKLWVILRFDLFNIAIFKEKEFCFGVNRPIQLLLDQLVPVPLESLLYFHTVSAKSY